MISHENLMKNGFIRINISLTIGKTSRYYEIIPKQKKSACKKSLFFGGKSVVFFGKIGKMSVLSGKIYGKMLQILWFFCEKSMCSYPGLCLHIDNQEYLRGVLLFEKLY